MDDNMRLVIIESPFAARKPDGSWDAGGVEENLNYLRAAMRDCLKRGEAPYASHALYTQPGVLDDKVPEERKLGMEAGFDWNRYANYTAVYVDRGVSSGMVEGLKNAVIGNRQVVVRSLPEWAPSPEEQARSLEKVKQALGEAYLNLYTQWRADTEEWEKTCSSAKAAT